jgi:DNA-directed RNA polymerase II subunit RPB1
VLLQAHLRATFAAKRVLREYKLTREAFDWILGEVEQRFHAVRNPFSIC